MDDLQAVAQIGTAITTTGALFLAWMLERKNTQKERENTEKERERAERYETVIVRLLENLVMQATTKNNGSGL